jgi:hypothetical protein
MSVGTTHKATWAESVLHLKKAAAHLREHKILQNAQKHQRRLTKQQNCFEKLKKKVKLNNTRKWVSCNNGRGLTEAQKGRSSVFRSQRYAVSNSSEWRMIG